MYEILLGIILIYCGTLLLSIFYLGKRLHRTLRTMLKLLEKLYKIVLDPAVKFRFSVTYTDDNNNQITKKGVSMFILKDNQKVMASVEPVSVKGNPAPLDGEPTWEVSNPDVLSVEVQEGGLSAEIFAVGPTGTSQVIVKGDADLGEGVVEIVGVLDVEVVGSMATGFAINLGEPVDVEEPAPDPEL